MSYTHRFQNPYRRTERRSFKLPDTGCDCVPWVVCEHHPLYPDVQKLVHEHYGFPRMVRNDLFDVLFPDSPVEVTPYIPLE
jgi:hypothetical protein